MNSFFNNRSFSIASKLLMGCFVVLAYGLIQGHSAFAATCTFNSTVTGNDWNTAANWDCGGGIGTGNVPLATDDVIIPAATTTNITAPANTNSINIQGTLVLGAMFNVYGNWTRSGTFTPGGVVVLKGSANQSIGAETFGDLAINKDGGTVTATGNIIVGGALSSSQGAGSATFNLSTFTLDVIGMTTIAQDVTVTSTTGTLTFGNLVTNNGSLGSSNGSMAFADRLLNNATGIFSVGSGTATSTGGISDNRGIIYGNSGMIATDGDFTNKNAGSFSPGTGTVKLFGSVSQNIAGQTYYNLKITKDTDSYVSPMGSITVSGNLTTSGACFLDSQDQDISVVGVSTIGAGTTVTSTTGTLTFSDLVTNFGNIGSSNGNMLFSGILLNNNQLDIGSGTATTTGISLGGTINGDTGMLVLTDYLTGAGTFNADSGTVRIAGAGDYNVLGEAFNKLETLKTGGTATFITNDVTVAGTLITAGGAGTLSAGSRALTVTGASTIGTGTTVTSTNGTLTFTGAVTANGTGAIGSSVGNMLFSNTLTLNGNSSLLSVGSGTATTTGALSGNVYGNAGTLVVMTSFNSANFFAGSGTVIIDGAAQVHDFTYNNLVIKTPGAITVNGPNNVIVNGTLTTLGTAAFNLGTKTLTVTGISTIGAGTTVTSTTGTLTFNSVVINAGSIGSVLGNMFFAGLINNGGGIFDLGSGSATTTAFTNHGTFYGRTGRLEIDGTFGGAGTFNAGTGTIRIGGGVAQNIKGVAFNNLEVMKSAGIATIVTANATVAGTLVTSGAGTLNADTLDLSVTGISTIGSGTTVTSTSGTLTFTDAVTNAGSIGSNAGNKLFSSTLVNTGILAIGSGVATTTDAVTGSGVIQGDAGTLVVLNNLTFATFAGGTGTLRVYSVGASNQNIKGGAFYNLEINKGSGTVTITDAHATVGGTFTTIGTGTLTTVAKNLTVTGISTIGAGTTVTSTSGSLYFTGAATNNGTIGSGIGNVTFVSTLANNGTLQVGGLTLVNGTLTNGGAGTINGGGANGVLEVRADFADTGTFNAQLGTFRIGGGATQSIKGEAFNKLTMTKTAGVATFTSNATVAGTLITSTVGVGTLNADTFNLSVTGASTIAANTTVTSTSGTLTFTGAATNAGSIGSVNGNKLFGGTLDNTGGVLVIGAGVATTTGAFTGAGTIKGNTGTLVVLGNMTGFTTFTANTGKLRVYGSSATDQSIKGATFYNVEIKKTGGTATLTTANATVGGTLVTIGTGTLTASSRNLTVVGASTVGTGSTVTSTSGTLTFAGVTNAGSLGSSFGPITMTSINNSNVFSLGNESTSTGAVINSGTIVLNGETFNVGGNWTDTGTLTPVGGGVKLSGTADQNIGTEANFYNFGLDKSAGIATLTGNVTTTGFRLRQGTLAVGSKIFSASGNYSNTGLITLTTGKIKHLADYENFVDSNGVTQTAYTTPGVIYLEVKDLNRNMNGTSADTITVPITVSAAGGSDSETVTLTETGPATGIFRSGAIGYYTGTSIVLNNGEIVVSAGGVGTETYTDIQDTADTGATTATLTYSGTTGGTGGGGGGGGGGGLPPVVTHYESGTSGADRLANLANLSSMGLPIHSLVKLADDGNGATQEDSAVYYVGNDGKRHAFPNSKIYFTWYKDFSGVRIITASQLASIPLGTNVRYKPGSRMVKFTTDLKVYAVDAKGTLRWVKTEALAKALYGNDWNTKIDDLSDAFFGNYSFGTEVNSAADFDVNKVMASEANISEDF